MLEETHEEEIKNLDDLIVIAFPRKTMTTGQIIEHYAKQGFVIRELPRRLYAEKLLERVKREVEAAGAYFEVVSQEDCSYLFQDTLPNGKIYLDERVIRVFEFVRNENNGA